MCEYISLMDAFLKESLNEGKLLLIGVYSIFKHVPVHWLKNVYWGYWCNSKMIN